MRLAAAELRLQPVDPGGRRVAAQARGDLAEHGAQPLGGVGLLTEGDGVDVVPRPTPAIDEAEVGGEHRLVERAVGDLLAREGDLAPGLERVSRH